ncbi:MAG: TIGR00730 family Rossman fold protein [Patescibacteria group bacterium]
MKKVCVFCSSSPAANKFEKPVIEFCNKFSDMGYELVWGGSNVGLMKLVAETVKSSGAKIHGVSLEKLLTQLRHDADSIYVAKSLAERVDKMIEFSDAFVILPGGSGTLDELAHVIELKRLGYHNKPIVIFNIEGFYDGIIKYFNEVFENEMQFIWKDNQRVKAPIEFILHVATEAEEVHAKLFESFRPKNNPNI